MEFLLKSSSHGEGWLFLWLVLAVLQNRRLLLISLLGLSSFCSSMGVILAFMWYYQVHVASTNDWWTLISGHKLGFGVVGRVFRSLLAQLLGNHGLQEIYTTMSGGGLLLALFSILHVPMVAERWRGRPL